MPSTTLVFVPFGAVITKSYNARPGVRLAVFAAVIDKVISPLALPVMVAVKLLEEDE
jgi:predicted Na+-dependent transporter